MWRNLFFLRWQFRAKLAPGLVRTRGGANQFVKRSATLYQAANRGEQVRRSAASANLTPQRRAAISTPQKV